MWEELLPCLSELITDTAGTHVMRALLCVAAGFDVDAGGGGGGGGRGGGGGGGGGVRGQQHKRRAKASDVDAPQRAAARVRVRVPPPLLLDVLSRVLGWLEALGGDDVTGTVCDAHASPFVQLLIEAVAANLPPGATARVIGVALQTPVGGEEGGDAAHVRDLMVDVVGSHVVEAALALSDDDAFDALLRAAIVGHAVRSPAVCVLHVLHLCSRACVWVCVSFCARFPALFVLICAVGACVRAAPSRRGGGSRLPMLHHRCRSRSTPPPILCSSRRSAAAARRRRWTRWPRSSARQCRSS